MDDVPISNHRARAPEVTSTEDDMLLATESTFERDEASYQEQGVDEEVFTRGFGRNVGDDAFQKISSAKK